MLEFEKETHSIKDAVIYARVSSIAQVKKGQGAESQATYCRQYAQWKGYAIHEVFKDSGITGSRADREGINAMFDYLRKHKSKQFVVIVDDISRLARDIRVHLDLRDAISECGAILESPSVTFGTDSDGRYFENMQALNAQHHREKNAEQTKKRQQARLIDGYWPFPASLGYKHETVRGHGKVMIPNEPIASIIKEALEGYACGRFQTQAEVSRFLESHPDFPKTKYGTVTGEATNRILTRVIYAGHVEAPTWNIPLRKGKHEGLISFETFQRIQKRLKGTPKLAVRSDIDQDFPLRGFVECHDCSNPLTACWSKSKTGKKHPYYMCHHKGCESKGKSIRRDDIEAEFNGLLETVQPSKTLVTLVQDMFKKAWSIQSETEATRKQAMKRTLSDTDKKIEGLLDRIIDSDNSSVISAYEKRIGNLEAEKLVLQENLAKTSVNTRPFNEMFELAAQFFANPQKIWRFGQLEHKRTVLKLVFGERLTYQRNKGFRTPIFSLVFKALEGFKMGESQMAESEGFEPSIEYHPILP